MLFFFLKKVYFMLIDFFLTKSKWYYITTISILKVQGVPKRPLKNVQSVVLSKHKTRSS